METNIVAESKTSEPEKPGKPCKFFVTDLSASKLLPNGLWQLNVSSKDKITKTMPLVHDGTVWIQGIVVQTTSSSTLVLEDDTGKAQIEYCTSVNDQMTWIKKGAYCLIIGKLLDASNTPIVSAMKLSCLDTDSVQKSAWKVEVEEVKYLLTDQIKITQHP